MTQTSERSLTTSQAAEIIGVSPSTVVKYADAGMLPSYRLPSGHRRYRREDVEALIGRHPDDQAGTDGGAAT
jgi:excisionase family DNA binding protein